MPILQELCQAFQQAINQYETEWHGRVSTDRQTQIAELRAYLNQCQNPLPNQPIVTALTVHHEMIEWIGNIPFEWKEFFLPGIRLNKALKNVLELPRFGEMQLMNTQYSEMQNAHQIQINTLTSELERLNGQVKNLLDSLEKERAKDSVQRVNELTQDLTIQQETNSYLTLINKQLREALEKSVDRKTHENLLAAHKTLQEKYDALWLKVSSNNQDTKPANDYSPKLFNN